MEVIRIDAEVNITAIIENKKRRVEGDLGPITELGLPNDLGQNQEEDMSIEKNSDEPKNNDYGVFQKNLSVAGSDSRTRQLL